MSDQETSPTTRKDIISFIQSLGEKDYAKADKHLQDTIENKLINKINASKGINIFTHER